MTRNATPPTPTTPPALASGDASTLLDRLMVLLSSVTFPSNCVRGSSLPASAPRAPVRTCGTGAHCTCASLAGTGPMYLFTVVNFRSRMPQW